MASEPVTLFSQTPNPSIVIDVLRNMSANFKVDGPDDAWREIVVISGKWMNRKRLTITHDPAYYRGPGWQTQMDGMRGYFNRFPDTPQKAKALALIGQFGFALGTICHSDAKTGDVRYEVISAIADALDAVWFTPSSLRDAHGRILYGAVDAAPDARWPHYLPVA